MASFSIGTFGARECRGWSCPLRDKGRVYASLLREETCFTVNRERPFLVWCGIRFFRNHTIDCDMAITSPPIGALGALVYRGRG